VVAVLWISPLALKVQGAYSVYMLNAYATTTCQVLNASTTECISVQSTSSPMYVQDAGNLQYAIAWVVFFNAMIFLGMVWNITPFNKGI